MRFLVILAVTCMIALPVFAGDFQSYTPKNPTVKDLTLNPNNRGLLDCSYVIEAELGVEYSFDTSVDGVSNVDLWPCSSWDESGPEMVFHIVMPDMWQVTLTTFEADLDGFILEGECDEVACAYAWDSGAVWTTAPLPGDFWFAVDGYGGAAGTFTILFEEVVPPPPPTPMCENLLPPFPGVSGDPVPEGTYLIAGDTCDSYNYLETLECATYAEAGFEHFYEINLDPGASIAVEVTNTADGGLWVVDACEDIVDANCLAYADDTLSGEAEILFYENLTGMRQGIYLVVDCYGTDSCGTYEGIITLFGGALANEDASWGAVKSLYR